MDGGDLRMVRGLRILGMGAAGVAGLMCALLFSAARSDFTFRGCPDIPRAEWEATVNCADGWLAQVVFGALGVGLAIVAFVIWRRGIS